MFSNFKQVQYFSQCFLLCFSSNWPAADPGTLPTGGHMEEEATVAAGVVLGVLVVVVVLAAAYCTQKSHHQKPLKV